MKKYSLKDSLEELFAEKGIKIVSESIMYNDNVTPSRPELDVSTLSGSRTTEEFFRESDIGVDNFVPGNPAFDFGRNLGTLIGLQNEGLTGDFGENIAMSVIKMLLPNSQVEGLDENQTSGKGNYGDVGTDLDSDTPAYYSVKTTMTATGVWPGIKANTAAKAMVGYFHDMKRRQAQLNPANNRGASKGLGGMELSNPAKLTKGSAYTSNRNEVSNDFEKRMGFGAVVIYFTDSVDTVGELRDGTKNLVPASTDEANPNYKMMPATLAIEVMQPHWLRGDMINALEADAGGKKGTQNLATLSETFMRVCKSVEPRWDPLVGAVRKTNVDTSGGQAPAPAMDLQNKMYDNPKGSELEVFTSDAQIKELIDSKYDNFWTGVVEKIEKNQHFIPTNPNGTPKWNECKDPANISPYAYKVLVKAFEQIAGKVTAELRSEKHYDIAGTKAKPNPVRSAKMPLSVGTPHRVVLKLGLTIPVGENIEVPDKLLAVEQQRLEIRRSLEDGTGLVGVLPDIADYKIPAEIQDYAVGGDLWDRGKVFKGKNRSVDPFYLSEEEMNELKTSSPGAENDYNPIKKRVWGQDPIEAMTAAGLDEEDTALLTDWLMTKYAGTLKGKQKMQIDPEDGGSPAAIDQAKKSQMAKANRAAKKLWKLSSQIFSQGGTPDLVIPLIDPNAPALVKAANKAIPKPTKKKGQKKAPKRPQLDANFKNWKRWLTGDFKTNDVDGKAFAARPRPAASYYNLDTNNMQLQIGLKPTTLMAAIYLEDEVKKKAQAEKYGLDLSILTTPLQLSAPPPASRANNSLGSLFRAYRLAKKSLYIALTEDVPGLGPLYTVTDLFAPNADMDADTQSIPTNKYTSEFQAKYGAELAPAPLGPELPATFDRYATILSLLHPDSTPEFWTQAELDKAILASRYVAGLVDGELLGDRNSEDFKKAITESKTWVNNTFSLEALRYGDAYEMQNLALTHLMRKRNADFVLEHMVPSRLLEIRKQKKMQGAPRSGVNITSTGQKNAMKGVIKKANGDINKNHAKVKAIVDDSQSPKQWCEGVQALAEEIKRTGEKTNNNRRRAGSVEVPIESIYSDLLNWIVKSPKNLGKDAYHNQMTGDGWADLPTNPLITWLALGTYLSNGCPGASVNQTFKEKFAAPLETALIRLLNTAINGKLKLGLGSAEQWPVGGGWMKQGMGDGVFLSDWVWSNIPITVMDIVWGGLPNMQDIDIPDEVTAFRWFGADKRANATAPTAPTLTGGSGVLTFEIGNFDAGLGDAEALGFLDSMTSATKIVIQGGQLTKVPTPSAPMTGLRELNLAGNRNLKLLPGMSSLSTVNANADFDSINSMYPVLQKLGCGSTGLELGGIPIKIETLGGEKVVAGDCQMTDLKIDGEYQNIDKVTLAFAPPNLIQFTSGVWEKRTAATGAKSFSKKFTDNAGESVKSPVQDEVEKGWQPLADLKAWALSQDPPKNGLVKNVPTLKGIYTATFSSVGESPSSSVKKGGSGFNSEKYVGDSYVRKGETLLEWSIRNGLIK